jgi:hypothetical protein
MAISLTIPYTIDPKRTTRTSPKMIVGISMKISDVSAHALAEPNPARTTRKPIPTKTRIPIDNGR